MTNQDEIDAIKQGVDLAPFMKACGIELKQVGGNYQGFCPFHENTKSPSLTVNPRENLWNCSRTTSPEESCRYQKAEARKAAVKEQNEKARISVSDKKLLARVVGYYQHTFTEDTTSRVGAYRTTKRSPTSAPAMQMAV
ncbi:hypothetical protein DGMP_38480 [Desulfomarina profundi]|uniref:Zinc finger CHC2-type domain-containing protein n=1 Tax=Desulfomarina profundi TaxID=2772557 RepID=A0A8D5JR46_9BACT|nr:CHC2 zinc finger domain-containing protein [Desulfomarina profundi]BCL63155.1 hypothetical protein DGMP_38480 [Desulfomarina profundi]